MSARAIDEPNRAASPLELLFDLTFVVAVAQVVIEFAHYIEDGHTIDGIAPFLMVFFAVWWAWMNFTWFASGYDTDDALYRVTTMVQMAGVLVLAAGVPAAFERLDYSVAVVGYAIMRLGLVAQWVRAAIQHPESRATATRYAVGVSVLQIAWWARLALPDELLIPSLFVLIALELCVPIWAGLAGEPAWHPHHIAERYGLFTIILLGESVLAATMGVAGSLEANGVSGGLVVVAMAGLVLLFSLWWLYFLEPAGHALERERRRAYLWGYGHFGMFAALAAIGSGLEAAVKATGYDLPAAPLEVAYSIAVPVAVFLLLLWILYSRFETGRMISPAVLLAAAVVTLALPLGADAMGVPAVTAATAGVCGGAVIATIVVKGRVPSRARTEA
jgi:low temperature requirement protein LtrA